MNTGATERVEGLIGNALRFGEGQVLMLDGKNEALRGMDQLTIEAWVRSSNEDSARRQRIIAFWEHYLISIFSGYTVMGHVYGPGGEGVSGAKRILRGSASLVPHQWMHIAVTYDGKRARIFVNGVQKNSVKMTGPVNGDDAGALTMSHLGADGFLGELDELGPLRLRGLGRRFGGSV